LLCLTAGINFFFIFWRAKTLPLPALQSYLTGNRLKIISFHLYKPDKMELLYTRQVYPLWPGVSDHTVRQFLLLISTFDSFIKFAGQIRLYSRADPSRLHNTINGPHHLMCEFDVCLSVHRRNKGGRNQLDVSVWLNL